MPRVLVCLVLVALVGGCGQVAPRPGDRADEARGDPDWQEFTSDEGRFAVSLPGKPERSESGGYQIFKVKAKPPRPGYFVHYADLPAALREQAQAFLTAYEQRTILKDFPDGKVVSTRGLDLGGSPGKEFILSFAKRGFVVRRVYCVEGRVYLVTASGEDLDRYNARYVKPFLDSFVVKREGLQKKD
jgi:hypothetical protein